jgi:hypothetical protein
MKETVLLIAVIAFIFLGYFPMKRLDFFLEKNRKRIAEEKEKDTAMGIISLRIADGSKISDDNIKELSEMYPSVEFTFENKEISIVCKSENVGETEIFIESLLSAIEKDV